MRLIHSFVVGAVCLTGLAARVPAVAQSEQSALSLVANEVRVGMEIAPVPPDLSGKNPGLVYLGSYLVNAVGGCNDCHTNPSYATGGDPFLGQPKQIYVAGYLAGGQVFGPYISRDITPFINGQPAGLTLAQFVHVIRTGEDPLNPGKLLQVMPWPTYQSMTDLDLKAIYLYLSAIPPIAPPR